MTQPEPIPALSMRTLTRRATPQDWPGVAALLSASGLPLDGAREHLAHFVVAEHQGRMLGVAGLEVHREAGLLRSVATDVGARSQGVAGALVKVLLDEAATQGLASVSLLTTTASGYFTRFGFRGQPRSVAPASLGGSAEFRGACPASATFMTLSIHKEPAMTQTVQSLFVLNDSSTRTVIGSLRAHPQRPLEFHLNAEGLIGPGYHVTEVKAVSIESMDCGGKANAWRETVIQLMDGSSEDAAGGFMTTRKFLAIYDRVTGKIPVRDEAEVRFEYGNAASPALQYHVAHLEVQPERLIVHLQTPGVQCKAGEACGVPTGDRLSASSNADAGCAPASGCCTPAAPNLIQLG
ncbi:arsenic resistance N-acetyltransferase ArsN2 [Deinococcus sp.]|uniref:arsenic resistance N-acetyltransferase ArsN2 n=1 Tax=Deinococcus sp. TaxID=47478 RepID=UPI003CC5AFCE